MTAMTDGLKDCPNPRKSRNCPFCGATPHHGLDKVEHCQLHGEPFQRFSIWCPRGCAKITRMNADIARHDWEGKPDAALVEALDHLVDCLVSELGNLANEDETDDEDLAAILGVDCARHVIASRLRIRQARALLATLTARAGG